MPGAKKDLTARVGVEAVRNAFVAKLGWYPREPSGPDYGIDVYVECADNGVPNGRLFGVQVKSGSSFFAEESEADIVFRGHERHLGYWLNHSLPVVVVLYEPDSDTAYWQQIEKDTIVRTGKGWKLHVPRANVLDASAAEALAAVAEGDPYILRLNQLRSDESWMRILSNSGEVFVEVAEWRNKSSGRGEIAVIGVDPETGKPVSRARAVFFGLAPYKEVLPRLFPWATLDVDEDLYAQHEEDLWQLEEGHYDKEEGRIIVYGDSFEDWRAHRGLAGLRPYSEEHGELARWRLRLQLNELGRSFLTLASYLAEPAGG